MNQSYTKFNYNLRSAKSVERKIIIEIIRGVTPHFREYSYVGFGSIFYTDFRLFHKELGIDTMVCIEKEEKDEQRFIFNKPYKCIELKIGISTEILTQLNFEEKSIIWLDYDETLKDYMFDDISLTFPKLKEKTFFLLTCNNSFPSFFDKDGDCKWDEFLSVFGNNIPIDATPKDLTKANRHNFLRRIFLNKIQNIVDNLNSIKEENEKLFFKQLFNFSYQDGAPMSTFGGILIKRADLESFENKPIVNSELVKADENAFEIIPPIVTSKEIDLMNKKLPENSDILIEDEDLKFIPKEFIVSYSKYYRYFPNYVEVRDI